MIDFTIRDEGSIMLLHANTPEAQEWVRDHIPDEAQTWAGAIVVEPRYMQEIADGIVEAGLLIE